MGYNIRMAKIMFGEPLGELFLRERKVRREVYVSDFSLR